MTDLEQRLRAALEAEADRRAVDTAALQKRVEARLSGEPRRRPRRAVRTVAPLVAAAAAAAAVAGTVVVLDRLRPDGPVGAGGVQVRGEVDDRFTCPSRSRTVFAESDDSFLPELTSDLRPAREATSLPRYEVEELGGGRVRVRFGDTDGTLANVVVFRAVAGGYAPVTVTKCTNGPGARGPDAVAGSLPPGSGAGQFTAADFSPGAVKLFDTVTYDVNGLALRQSVWAEPDGRGLSLSGGVRTSYVRGRLHRRDVQPTDATSFLYDPDTIVGQRTGYRLVVSYDGADALGGVSWESRDGRSTEVEPVTGAWSGQLFAMVVPRDDFAGVTLHRLKGSEEFFPADWIKE